MAKATPPRTYETPGEEMLALFVQFLLQKLQAAIKEGGEPLTAAEQNVVRQFLADGALTLASVKAANFGEFARQVAEDFPVDDQGERRYQ